MLRLVSAVANSSSGSFVSSSEYQQADINTFGQQFFVNYRYKDIIVQKSMGFTQVWLITTTKMKNAFNQEVGNICVCS